MLKPIFLDDNFFLVISTYFIKEIVCFNKYLFMKYVHLMCLPYLS